MHTHDRVDPRLRGDDGVCSGNDGVFQSTSGPIKYSTRFELSNFANSLKSEVNIGVGILALLAQRLERVNARLRCLRQPVS